MEQFFFPVSWQLVNIANSIGFPQIQYYEIHYTERMSNVYILRRRVENTPNFQLGRQLKLEDATAVVT